MCCVPLKRIDPVLDRWHDSIKQLEIDRTTNKAGVKGRPSATFVCRHSGFTSYRHGRLSTRSLRRGRYVK